MARKQKNRQKQRRKRRSKARRTASVAASPAVGAGESVSDPDEAQDLPVGEASHEPAPDDVEPIQVVDITSDDDLDDAEARARLIAAAVAEAATELPPGRNRDDGPATPPEPLQLEGDDAAGEARDASPATETHQAASRPLLPPDALVALSAIHREGLASLPAEHIIDLGEATTEAERDQLLAAALAHAELQDAKYRVPTESSTARRWKAGIAGALLLVASITAASPPGFVASAPSSRLTVADGEHGARLALMLQAQQIEAFRVSEGRLPDTLEDLPQSVPGVRFVRSTNRVYQLVTRGPDGHAIVYDSAAPDQALESVRPPWITTQESP